MALPTSVTASTGEPEGVSRRTVLKLAAVGTLGLAAGFGASAGLTQIGRTPAPSYHFFSDSEARLLIAICEQIIPRDDTPGATDAGVIFYIDRQICGPLARHQQSYRLGLESFPEKLPPSLQGSFRAFALRAANRGAAPHRVRQGAEGTLE